MRVKVRHLVASRIYRIAQSGLFNVILPLLTYPQLTSRGVSPALAWIIVGIWPAVELAIEFGVHRRLDEIALLALALLALSVPLAIGFNSPRVLAFKDGVSSIVTGALFLGSLAAHRPLTFYLGRRVVVAGSAADTAAWNARWADARFRRAQRLTTAVWGGGVALEGTVKIVLSFVLQPSHLFAVATVLQVPLGISLLGWTVVYWKGLGTVPSDAEVAMGATLARGTRAVLVDARGWIRQAVRVRGRTLGP